MGYGARRPSGDARRSAFADLEPEIVLPGQLDGRDGIWLQPERSLMLAVLEEAISTFRKYVTAETRRGRRLFAEAEHWCLEDDAAWPFSFTSICTELGIEPAWLRKGLLAWRDRRRAMPHPPAAAPSPIRRRSSGSRTRATSHAGLMRHTA